MKKIRELQGDELMAWQRDYPRREALRAIIEERRKQGTGPIELIIKTALEEEPTEVFGSEVIFQEYERAKTAERDADGANLDVKVREIDANKITTPEEIEKWGNTFRIHPLIREAYLQQIRDGQRIMLVAEDREGAAEGEDGEPAGRVSLINGGPIGHQVPQMPDPKEFKGKPTEADVVAELGGPSPWVEDLVAMEGYRRSGVGQRLMKRLEEIVRSNRDMPQKLGLAVRPDNAKAIAMYEKLGYQRMQIAGQETFVAHMQAVPPHEDLLMVKDLSQLAQS